VITSFHNISVSQNSNEKGGEKSPPFSRSRGNYSSAGALTGHASAQEPQLMHSSALITYLPSPSEMQLTGQASAQAPQLMHSSEILYAILKTSIFVVTLF
jgi:hypothetical protein